MRAALTTATPSRLLMAAHALRQDMSQEDVCGLSHFSPWFIEQLGQIIATEAKIAENGLPDNEEAMRAVKAMGFADARLAELTDSNEDAVRASRQGMNVRPYFRQIDTCAAEFSAGTPYLYSSYDAPSAFDGQQEAEPSDRKKAVILGAAQTASGKVLNLIIAAATRPMRWKMRASKVLWSIAIPKLCQPIMTHLTGYILNR